MNKGGKHIRVNGCAPPGSSGLHGRTPKIETTSNVLTSSRVSHARGDVPLKTHPFMAGVAKFRMVMHYATGVRRNAPKVQNGAFRHIQSWAVNGLGGYDAITVPTLLTPESDTPSEVFWGFPREG